MPNKKSLASHLNPSNKTQSEKVSENQIKNSDGCFVFEISDEKKLERFLVLGTSGGTFYSTEKDLTVKSAENVIKMIKDDKKGDYVLDTLIRVSESGIARKNDYAILVLALVLTYGSNETKGRAIKSVTKVCRTGTHLFYLAETIKNIRGWGTTVKKIFQHWYLSQTVNNVTYQMIKYQNRNGWTHKDLLTMSHVKTSDVDRNLLFNYFVNKEMSKNDVKIEDMPSLKILIGYEKAKVCKDEKEIIKLIKEYSLTREMIPTEFLNKPNVIDAMLPHMGLTALIRSLASYTANDYFKNNFERIGKVVEKITNQETVSKSMIHPIQILEALRTYSSGEGVKGSLRWNPELRIVDALDKAFYMAFKNVKPTGKNIFIALDCSASMTWHKSSGSILTPREISSAMALVTMNVEKNYILKGFGDTLFDLKISPSMRLDDVLRYIGSVNFGSTYCDLPMTYAIKEKIKDIDAFIVYTDNETNHTNGKHPFVALKDYRKEMNKPKSKLIVVGCEANDFSIADPSDGGMFDIVGASADLPHQIEIMLNE